jgi:uncharacterized protein (DUF885 family)
MTALTRRQALAAAASTTALARLHHALPRRDRQRSPQRPAPHRRAQATALLDSVAANLLALSPESATSLGIDKGANAALRSQLSDRSPAGQARLAAVIRSDLARVNASTCLRPQPLDPHQHRSRAQRLRTALQGFALPYGDVAVGGWRNSPYVVIQNVGAYLDIPRFLDSDHQIETAADAEAYLARLASAPAQLDGETARIIDAAARA